MKRWHGLNVPFPPLVSSLERATPVSTLGQLPERSPRQPRRTRLAASSPRLTDVAVAVGRGAEPSPVKAAVPCPGPAAHHGTACRTRSARSRPQGGPRTPTATFLPVIWRRAQLLAACVRVGVRLSAPQARIHI